MALSCKRCLCLVYLILMMVWCAHGSAALGKFGFDIHHRYSDSVKKILGIDGLPGKDTLDYYKAMVHRDHLLRGRRLAGGVDSPPLTFDSGNLTLRVGDLGFLHYAFVDVGTPNVTFLVALDTGSDLFWLPCDCPNCPRNFTFVSGEQIDFSIYSRNASTTSKIVPCNSTMCGARNKCLTGQTACAYQVRYLSANTSSTGILVEDVLHLVTDGDQQNKVDTPITLGCGMIQTGAFLTGGALNGLFGLGMENISVPSILANKGLTANSFSMCFGPDGIGRIEFGDKGSSDQGETPFNLEQLHPTYNISITQVAVGDKIANVTFTAIFDSGTSFTMLGEPDYTIISESFNSEVHDPRRQNDSRIPFEYCYDLKSTPTGPERPQAPRLTLTMKDGDQFNITRPLILFRINDVEYIYCLAIIKSENITIIGQNFMTGYRVVFDREKMVLGWKESNCYDDQNSEFGSKTPSPPPTPPPTPTPRPPPPTGRQNSTDAPPATEEQEATPGNNTFVQRGGGNAAPSNSFTKKLPILLFSLFSHYLIILSS